VLRLRNLVTGEYLPEAIGDVDPNVAWAKDNATVLYVEKDPETLLGKYVKRHRLSSDPLGDTLIFEQVDNTLYTGVSKSKSDRFIFLHTEGTLTSEWHYAEADDPSLSFTVFAPRRKDHEYEIEHLDDTFIVRTNWQAENFRLMSVPIGEERETSRWRELIAHREDTLIEDFEVFSNFVVLTVRSGGLSKLAVKPLQPSGAAEFFIDSDEAAYCMAISSNPELGSDVLRYTYSSLATPSTVYDYDLRTGTRRLLKRDTVLGRYDPLQYRTEFLFAPSRDGKRIPVSLVYRRDLVRDGSAPLLQYAYGAYGLSMDPGFSSARFSLIDRGFVYAIAHVRGGQEMGRSWYDAGRLLHKQNSFRDFVDVTRFLVAADYCAPDNVFAMGGSAGGLLVAAVANIEPAGISRHRRAGAFRRHGHHHVGRQHSAHQQRVRRMGGPRGKSRVRLHAVVLAL